MQFAGIGTHLHDSVRCLGVGGSRWTCYEQAAREYVFGGSGPVTGRKRPRLPNSPRRLALLQAIWGLVLGVPSLASTTVCTD